jgi:transposase-like protein
VALLRAAVNTYYDTRGSYRRTSRALKGRISYTQLYRIIDKLGEGCKTPVQVANELRPRWSGMLGLDTKVVKVRGEERYLLIAVDIETQDVVDSWLASQESLVTLELFLREVRDGIHYVPKLAVIDLDQTWRGAVENVFPYVPIQLCVVHFERIVDRIIPKMKRTPRQMELKQMVRDVLYAPNENGAKDALERLLKKRGSFRDKKSRQVINSLKENFELLTTHFRVKGSVRSNNAAESVNDKLGMKLWLIRGYKKVRTARNSLNLMVMHYRFNRFSSCRIKEHNGKSPLDLASVDTSRLDWILYSQTNPSVLKAL